MLPAQPFDVVKAATAYRAADTFLHCVTCVRPWGVLESVLCWCQQECTSEWRWRLIEMPTDRRPGTYDFYFDSERDAVAFSLQWS